MCKTKKVLTSATIHALFFAAGIAFALFFGGINQHAVTVRVYRTIHKATLAEGKAALAFLARRMPNTHFVRAVPDPVAPGLLRLYTGKNPEPVYFDPLRRYLMIGLVVNLGPGAPNAQSIAGGRAAGAGHPHGAGRAGGSKTGRS